MKLNNTADECKYLVWVRDDKGVKFICYAEDFNSETHAPEEDQDPRLRTGFTLDPHWH